MSRWHSELNTAVPGDVHRIQHQSGFRFCDRLANDKIYRASGAGRTDMNYSAEICLNYNIILYFYAGVGVYLAQKPKNSTPVIVKWKICKHNQIVNLLS
jgi:hypothetical protein